MSEPTTYPAPQADRLDVVVAVVVAVSAGCDTATSAAQSINLCPRQGAYYTNAAGSLGWLEKHPDTVPATWSVTTAGELLLTGSPLEQAATVIDAVLESDDAAGYDPHDDGASLESGLIGAGLDTDTAGRRVQTVRSWWRDAGLDLDALAALLVTEQDALRVRLPDAIDVATTQHREARAAARAAAPRTGSTCPGCFTALPLTGRCDNC